MNTRKERRMKRDKKVMRESQRKGKRECMEHENESHSR
jgi:hypothetical protein